VQEFSLNKIKDIDDANKFLKNYVKKFNKKFSVKPKGDPIFREPGKEVVLDYILCRKEIRKFDNGSAFSFKSKYYEAHIRWKGCCQYFPHKTQSAYK
jgi:hypothetical protein